MHFYLILRSENRAVELKKKTKVKPDAGLEPATVGLKVQRSTD